MHSDLAGSAAGLREIPIEGSDAGSEQHEEEETAKQPKAPCPPGHGCAKRVLLWHSEPAFQPFKLLSEQRSPLEARPAPELRPSQAPPPKPPGLVTASLEFWQKPTAVLVQSDVWHRPTAKVVPKTLLRQISAILSFLQQPSKLLLEAKVKRKVPLLIVWVFSIT